MKEILLSQGLMALVDDEDYEWLNQYKWYAHKSGNTYYAVRNISTPIKRTMSRMHRVILNAPKGIEVDHEDHDGLNNQKYNIRLGTHGQNQHNQQKHRGTSSQYKGVYWYKRTKQWRARIKINKKYIHLGYFDIEIEAALAYDQAARIHYGEFAHLNLH